MANSLKYTFLKVTRIKITDNQVCAGTGDKDTCTGDSGGPMLADQVDYSVNLSLIISGFDKSHYYF